MVKAERSGAGFVYGVNTDYDTTPPFGVPNFTPSFGAQWGTGLWGSGKWSGNPVIQKGWQSAAGTGNCAALHIIASTLSGKIEWSATDYAWKSGGIL